MSHLLRAKCDYQSLTLPSKQIAGAAHTQCTLTRRVTKIIVSRLSLIEVEVPSVTGRLSAIVRAIVVTPLILSQEQISLHMLGKIPRITTLPVASAAWGLNTLVVEWLQLKHRC